jgi:hypothetical protein
MILEVFLAMTIFILGSGLGCALGAFLGAAWIIATFEGAGVLKDSWEANVSLYKALQKRRQRG